MFQVGDANVNKSWYHYQILLILFSNFFWYLMKISEVVSELIKNQGITKAEVYKYLGLSQEGFKKKIENDTFTANEINALATFFDIDPGYFFAHTNASSSNASFYSEKSKKVKVPVIPLSFYGTFVHNDDTEGWRLDELLFTTITIERKANIKYELAVVIQVEGNSMEPNIRDGAKILCTWVSDGRWQYLQGVHAISLKDGMLLVKRVSASGDGFLILKSDNPNYGEIKIQLADIQAVWKAERKVDEEII